MSQQVPIILFAYARPEHLRSTLSSLRNNKVPIIYAFSDAPKTSEMERSVNEVRRILHTVDWCQIHVTERDQNLGLGKSILAGVGEVLRQHDSALVFEDDITCTPGAYQYLSAALNRYRDEPRVMSVTGWTHACVTPTGVNDQPYFDGRAECWGWGTWARAWIGMDKSAAELMKIVVDRGMDPYKYGADLVAMAEQELSRNIWAVRMLFLHILHGGLCLRPPWAMVEHIGFDAAATNAVDAGIWNAPPLLPCPPAPQLWPDPIDHPDCAKLWRAACGAKPSAANPVHQNLKRIMRRFRALRGG